MNYKEAREYIDNTAKFGSNLGLTRTEKILELIGNPHLGLRCIHIAGTNGKGSTSAMMNSILINSGYRVGMYTSPFLEEFEERIQINNENIPKEDLAEVVTEVSKAVTKVIELGFDHPTEFEIITCAMFLYFKLKEVDYAVVEVGLGGRLDSTNVIKPILSIITSISMDHTNILGDTLSVIAYEKAGIIKPGVPVICAMQEKEAQEVIALRCRELNCELIMVGQSAEFIEMEQNLQLVKLKTDKTTYSFKLSLLGKHQLLNCANAVAASEKLMYLGLKISVKNIEDAMGNVRWIGRLEILKKEPLVVIDGAHNIEGITLLKESINTYFKFRKIILIIGILKDKQVEDMVSIITPMAERVITVTPNSFRAEDSKELSEIIEKYNNKTEACRDYRDAYNKALEYSDKEDMILVCGSLYMIGDMRKVIRKNR
ncbi:MAG: bifunctional folylpolyglutamate synthase/dihydrofolate synthase [Solirubrobacterales bacterium]